MQGLAFTYCKTVFNKLLILGKNRAFYDPVSAVKIIIEKRVAYVLHMHPDLVGPASFQLAFDKGHVIESCQNLVMGNGLFPMFPFRVGSKQFSKPLVPAHMTSDRAFVFLEIPPYQRYVPPVYSMVEKLLGEIRHGLRRFGKHQ